MFLGLIVLKFLFYIHVYLTSSKLKSLLVSIAQNENLKNFDLVLGFRLFKHRENWRETLAQNEK